MYTQKHDKPVFSDDPSAFTLLSMGMVLVIGCVAILVGLWLRGACNSAATTRRTGFTHENNLRTPISISKHRRTTSVSSSSPPFPFFYVSEKESLPFLRVEESAGMNRRCLLDFTGPVDDFGSPIITMSPSSANPYAAFCGVEAHGSGATAQDASSRTIESSSRVTPTLGASRRVPEFPDISNFKFPVIPTMKPHGHVLVTDVC
ncbi:hypothetical protein FISHEDRAFT_78743 [Fistulina hepatica ATCC 64428]|uniref:Uncharacterized protein n=1 Tax=Fistulina hepatica ATCC 64428 TaxID=1128425 RepID=A0A0D7A0C6_9AGAR|nr:hypothetical protein FISHEDRAFT_78743 [Fistulina hepatica ATCC 64428]